MEEPIRVLMITSEWPSPDKPRTTHFIKRQADFLQAGGVDVSVFHFRGAKRFANYVRAWAQVQRKLRREHYDIVHAQFGQSGMLALPKRLPLVVTYRGSDLLGIVDDKDGRRTGKGRILQRLSQMVALVADVVIVVSEHMKEYLNPAIQAHVIPSGIDFGLFRCMPRDDARRRLGLPLDEQLVLFVGRPTQALKRFMLAQRAVEILNDSLPTKLIVAWGINHTDIPFYMNACDVLVFTSMQEGSPNVVKEALACNLPVVSVDIGDVALRLQGIEGCELCVDERPEAIAAALERVLRRGGRIASREVVKDLDEKLLAGRVINIYRSMLARREPVLTASRHLQTHN